MDFKAFQKSLDEAHTEEAVKNVYARYFDIPYNTTNHHDLYTPTVFFEFKAEKNFHNLKALATVLAQALCYIRRLKYSDAKKTIPFFICLADRNEAAITETRRWSSYYTNDTYDWERAASKPDPRLIDGLVKEAELANTHVYTVVKKGEHDAFKTNLENALNPQLLLEFGDKKVINEENFEAVFEHWKSVIGHYIENGYKDSFYFLANIQRSKVVVDRESNRVVFTFEDKNSKTQKVLMKDYDFFWGLYDYVDSQEVIEGIHSKLDRLTDESQRRFEGEFYTPLVFARKAIHYWDNLLGKNWYKTGKYRIWDMCAGPGNLEYDLPAEAYKYLYLSTLHASEAEHLKKVFRGACCFQYDYLNDDVSHLFSKDELAMAGLSPEWKLPEKLRDELKDPKITWIVYINPPFATAQDAKKVKSKTGVSKTKVEVLMDKEHLAHAKRELFAQFMFRIAHELPKNTFLGMFSKLKYLNGPDTIDFRDRFFSKRFEKGFVFDSRNFHGVKGTFPVGFLIWNLAKPKDRDELAIDISNHDGESVGSKHLRLIKKGDVLNNWFPRPSNSAEFIMPPLSNGITVKDGNVDIRHRARSDFLASMCSNGNDFQHAKYVVILSSPSASAGAFTVNPENFEKAMALHAVKKIPVPTWLNDRNQFLVPHTEPGQEFLNDCVVWSLFASSNETTALKDVKYAGKLFQIKNNFFPFTIAELSRWGISDADTMVQMRSDDDRFVAEWLSNKTLTNEAKDVLHAGRNVYKVFFLNLHNVSTKKLKINTWDVGWYQVRICLKDHSLGGDELKKLAEAHSRLREKILPQIEAFGFLDRDETYE